MHLLTKISERSRNRKVRDLYSSLEEQMGQSGVEMMASLVISVPRTHRAGSWALLLPTASLPLRP
jgi:hypothetical protein